MLLYLTPAAIGYLTQLILSGLITVYFIHLSLRSHMPRHILLLTGFFTFFTGFILSSFFEAALMPTPRLYAVFVQNIMLALALVCLIQFAYHFPILPASLRIEARLALAVSGIYTLWEGGYAVYRFTQLAGGQVLYRPNESDAFPLLLFGWAAFAFLHQLYVLPPGAGRRFDSILHPSDRVARGTRTFALIFLFVAVLNIFTDLRNYYLLSVSLANLGISVGILVALLAFAVTYLTTQSATTSFMIRLVGVTLTVILAVVGIVGWVLTPVFETHFEPDLPDHRTLRFTPNLSGGYDIREIVFAFEPEFGHNLLLDDGLQYECSPAQNFAFPFYGQKDRPLYVCNDGTIGIGRPIRYRTYQYRYGAGAPAILALLIDFDPTISEGGIFVRQELGRMIVTWDRLRAFHHPADVYTFQAVLYPDGSFDLSYNGLPSQFSYRANDEPGANAWAIGVSPGSMSGSGPQNILLSDVPLSTGPQGALQEPLLAFRQYLNDLLAPLAGLTLAVSAFIGLFFPLLLYISLVEPLNRLLSSVRRMEAGDYSSNLTVIYPDEIGYLTHAFNRVAAQLGDLIHNLEARVTERTYELDKVNVQLHTEIEERERAQIAVLEKQRVLAAFEERERMGRELHDGLGQLMGYVNVQVQAVQVLLADHKLEAAQVNLDELALSARSAYFQIRAHILGLRTPDLKGSAFFDVVAKYVEIFGEKEGITASLSLPERTPFVLFGPGDDEQMLRIIQEALTNVAKHAHARRVEVVFSLIGENVQVIIRDDGVGFDLTQRAAACQNGRGNFGLDIMRERAEKIGGTLEVRSTPGEGTWVAATLPRFLPVTGGGGSPGIQGLRVLLADDHPLFLDGLRNLLTARGLTVVAGVRDGQEALEKCRLLRPDVAVLDLHMPVMNGLEATRAIRAELPEIKVVLLTAAEEDEPLFEAIKSGASGYLLKSLEANQFCALLTGLMNGEVALAPGMAERVMQEFSRQPDHSTAPHAELNARQLEILQMVADGQTYKEIGAFLNLTEKTIKYHMGQILDCLHLEKRAQAITYLRKFYPDP